MYIDVYRIYVPREFQVSNFSILIYLGGFDILWLNPKSNRAFVGH